MNKIFHHLGNTVIFTFVFAFTNATVSYADYELLPDDVKYHYFNLIELSAASNVCASNAGDNKNENLQLDFLYIYGELFQIVSDIENKFSVDLSDDFLDIGLQMSLDDEFRKETLSDDNGKFCDSTDVFSRLLPLIKKRLKESLAANSLKQFCAGNCTNGQGTETYPNGDKYEGGFKDGKYHGQGTYTYASGAKYEGGFKDGKYHGQGTYTYASGAKYEGEWKDDKQHAQGTYTYPNGDKYEGQFKDGKRHGQGTYTYASGAKYEGQFKDGKRHGQGIATFANGAKYEGEWKDGKQHGQGILTYAIGSAKYEGQFKDGKRHGQGTETLANGAKYPGVWVNDERQ